MNGAGPLRARTLHERIGGDVGVRRLVDSFYDIVEREQEGEPVHRLHFGNLGMHLVRQSQFDFLCVFLGGRPPGVRAARPPDLRDMHRHLSFGAAEGKAWLACMARAIDETGIEPDLGERLLAAFRKSVDTLVADQSSRAGP